MSTQQIDVRDGRERSFEHGSDLAIRRKAVAAVLILCGVLALSRLLGY